MLIPKNKAAMTLAEAIGAVKGRCLQGDPASIFQGVCTDTRTLLPGELFVALRGERFDGHAFLLDAARRGASGLIGRMGSLQDIRSLIPAQLALIEVDDTLYALGELARHHRRKHTPLLIAITGSNGKTTTKEMTACILRLSHRVFKTEGNLNNLIGVPLTLLQMAPHHQVGIVEMGTNRPGEIKRLCEIVEPKVGLITNVAEAHLEFLRDKDTVAREKGELFRCLGEDGTAVVNIEDPSVVEQAIPIRANRLYFGRASKATVRAEDEKPFHPQGARFKLVVNGEELSIKLKAHGRPFIQNALAASALAWVAGATPEQIKEGLEMFTPQAMRSQFKALPGGLMLLDDSYNANPASMKAALETVSKIATGRIVAVLGDMLELGDGSAHWHRTVGSWVADSGVDFLVTVGRWGEQVVQGAMEGPNPPARLHKVENASEALKVLKGELKPGDWILVKGSRAVGLDIVVQGIAEMSAEGPALATENLR